MLAKIRNLGSTLTKFKIFSVFKGIQLTLMLAFMIPISCIIALGIISYNKAAKIIIHNYETSMSQTLDMTGQYFSFSLGTVQADLDEIYQSVDLRDYFDGIYNLSPTKEIQLFNATQDSMKNKSWSDDLIENMYILSDDKSFLTTKPESDQLYASYAATEQGAEVAADDSIYHWFGANTDQDELLGSDSSKYAIRVARNLETADAILMADINKDEILKILNRLSMGTGSYLALVSKDGNEIQPENGNAEGSITENVFYGQEYYQNAMMSDKSSDAQYIQYKKDTYLFLYNKIGTTGFMICSLIPKSMIVNQVSDVKWITLMIVLFTCIISAVVCAVIAGGIGNTLRHMKKQLKKVSQGDLTIEIKSKRKDEFSSLALDITNMIISMKELIEKVKDVGVELVSTINLLADTSKTFVNSTDDIQVAVAEIEAGIIQLDENSEDCLGQMSTLSDKINLVHVNINRISEITNTTEQSIDTGILTMEELNAKAQDTTLITNRVIDIIKLLEAKTMQIGNIVGVINEISEQTNLLSLNASIESARVGAAGRGFEVIANEIRKLADNSLKSSSQIQKIIKEIVQNIKEAVNTAEEAEVVVSLQKLALNNTSNSFNVMDLQIVEMITEANAIIKNVADMEQARVTTEEAIQSISAVSEETTACSDSVSTTVKAQRDAVNQVDDTVKKLLCDADILSEAINRFKIV
ncbi:MAG: methyl-accepting chemotaxis protein [Mobilitalea sp.]